MSQLNSNQKKYTSNPHTSGIGSRSTLLADPNDEFNPRAHQYQSIETQKTKAVDHSMRIEQEKQNRSRFQTPLENVSEQNDQQSNNDQRSVPEELGEYVNSSNAEDNGINRSHNVEMNQNQNHFAADQSMNNDLKYQRTYQNNSYHRQRISSPQQSRILQSQTFEYGIVNSDQMENDTYFIQDHPDMMQQSQPRNNTRNAPSSYFNTNDQDQSKVNNENLNIHEFDTQQKYKQEMQYQGYTPKSRDYIELLQFEQNRKNFQEEMNQYKTSSIENDQTNEFEYKGTLGREQYQLHDQNSNEDHQIPSLTKSQTESMPSYVFSSANGIPTNNLNSSIKSKQNFNFQPIQTNQTLNQMDETDNNRFRNYRNESNDIQVFGMTLSQSRDKQMTHNNQNETSNILSNHEQLPSGIHYPDQQVQKKEESPNKWQERYEVIQTSTNLNNYQFGSDHANLRMPSSPTMNDNTKSLVNPQLQQDSLAAKKKSVEGLPPKSPKEPSKLIVSQSQLFNPSSTTSLHERAMNILMNNSKYRRHSTQASPRKQQNEPVENGLKRSKTNRKQNMRYCINKLFQKATGVPRQKYIRDKEYRVTREFSQTGKQSSLGATLRQVERSQSPMSNVNSLRRKANKSNSPNQNLIQTPYSIENVPVNGFQPLRNRSKSGKRNDSKNEQSNFYSQSEMAISNVKGQFLANRLSHTQENISVDNIPTRLSENPPSFSNTGVKNNEQNRLNRFKKIEKEISQEKQERLNELERMRREADEKDREIKLQQMFLAEQERRRQEQEAQKKLEQLYQHEREMRAQRETINQQQETIDNNFERDQVMGQRYQQQMYSLEQSRRMDLGSQINYTDYSINNTSDVRSLRSKHLKIDQSDKMPIKKFNQNEMSMHNNSRDMYSRQPNSIYNNQYDEIQRSYQLNDPQYQSMRQNDLSNSNMFSQQQSFRVKSTDRAPKPPVPYQQMQYQQQHQEIEIHHGFVPNRYEFESQQFEKPFLPQQQNIYNQPPAPPKQRRLSSKEQAFLEYRYKMQKQEEDRQRRYKETSQERAQKYLDLNHQRLMSEPGAAYSQPNFEGGSIDSQFDQMGPVQAFTHINSFRDLVEDSNNGKKDDKILLSLTNFQRDVNEGTMQMTKQNIDELASKSQTIDSQSRIAIRRPTIPENSQRYNSLDSNGRVKTEVEESQNSIDQNCNNIQNHPRTMREHEIQIYTQNESFQKAPTSQNEYLSMVNILPQPDPVHVKQLEEQKEIAQNLEKQVGQLNCAITQLKEDHSSQIKQMQEFCSEQINMIRKEYEQAFKQEKLQQEKQKFETQLMQQSVKSHDSKSTDSKSINQEAAELLSKIMNQDQFMETIQHLNKVVGQKQTLENKLQRIKDKIKAAKNIKNQMNHQHQITNTSLLTDNMQLISLTNTMSDGINKKSSRSYIPQQNLEKDQIQINENQSNVNVLAYQEQNDGVYQTANFAPSTIQTQTIESRPDKKSKQTIESNQQLQNYHPTEKNSIILDQNPSIQSQAETAPIPKKKKKDKKEKKDKHKKKEKEKVMFVQNNSEDELTQHNSQMQPEEEVSKDINESLLNQSSKLSEQNDNQEYSNHQQQEYINIVQQQSTDGSVQLKQSILNPNQELTPQRINTNHTQSQTFSKIMSHNISEQRINFLNSKREFENQLNYSYIPKDLMKNKTDNLSGISKIDSKSNFNSQSNLPSQFGQTQTDQQKSTSNLSEVMVKNPVLANNHQSRPSVQSFEKSMVSNCSYNEENMIVNEYNSSISTPQRCQTNQQMQTQNKNMPTFNPASFRKLNHNQMLQQNNNEEQFQMIPEQLKASHYQVKQPQYIQNMPMVKQNHQQQFSNIHSYYLPNSTNDQEQTIQESCASVVQTNTSVYMEKNIASNRKLF